MTEVKSLNEESSSPDRKSDNEINSPTTTTTTTCCFFTLLSQQPKKYLPVLSVVIILIASTIKYLTELEFVTFGLFCPVSWENPTFVWCCLIVYSLGLVFISFLVSSKRFNSTPNCPTLSTTISTTIPDTPNSLTRLRNHLTFLPIIHFIQQQNTNAGTGEGGGVDGISSISCNDPTLHTKDGHDKEYFSKLEFQRDALVEAILENCISPWYERISDDKTFLLQSKTILQAFFDRLVQQFHQIDRTTLAKEAIEVTHFHWKSYCEAARKVTSPTQSIGEHFKFVHDFVTVPEDLSKHYENLLCHLLKQFIVSDLQSTLICQFLSGILIKGFVLYYVELTSDPKWINTSLKKLIDHESNITEQSPPQSQSSNPFSISIGSSQESLFDSSTCCKTKNDSIKIHTTDSIDSTNCEVFSTVPDCPVDSSSSSSSDSDLPQESTDRNTISSTHNEAEAREPEPQETLEEKTNLWSLRGIPVVGKSSSTKRKKRTNVPSVSAALGGLLSATALPLLPGGSGYNLNLNGLDSHTLQVYEPPVTTSETTLDNETNIINTTQDEQIISSHDDKQDSVISTTNQPFDETPVETTKSFVEKVMTATSFNAPSYRHYSCDDGPKNPKTILSTGERDTKSLDETKNNCSMARQEEFDIHFDDPRKIDMNSSTDQTISPMYDEGSEDFAATIAKLRSLLEQRESQKNLMENVTMGQNTENEADVFKTNNTPPEEGGEHSPEHVPVSASSSHPQPIKKNSNADSTRPSLNSQSSASSLGSDVSGASTNCSWDNEKLEKIVDELEETNNPVLNRFFLNVSIPKTETCSDSSSGQFVLYCIQYEGVYVEENDDGQLDKLVLRTTTIKRRFQEFLMLQNQLEESIWRPHVKGKARIGRSWILSDNTNINQRKIILERYLHQLCYNPVLGFCPQLRKFMAYGEEGFQAFATSDAIPLHRFDKLAKKFSGVFNSLRDALPSFESDLLAIPNCPDGQGGGKSPDSKAKSLFTSFLEQTLRAEKLASSSSSSSDSVDEGMKLSLENNNASSGKDTSSKWENKGTAQDNNLQTDAQFVASGQKSSETLLEEQVEGVSCPLAVAATNLLCDVLWLPQHRPHSASVSTFLRISGKSFESYLQESLDIFFSKGSLLGYLESVTIYLKSTAIQDCNKCDESTLENEIQYSETDLKNCLKQKIPVWVCWMWGVSRLDRLTKVCQNADLNKDLMLSLVELLFSKLIVDTTKVENEGK